MAIETVFVLSEIRDLCSGLYVSFQHVRWVANGVLDSLAKQGINRYDLFTSLTLCNFLFLSIFTSLSSFVLLFVLWFLNVVLLFLLKEGTPQQTCQWPRRTLQNAIGSGCNREKPNENSLLAAQCAMRNLYYREELKSEESYEENNCVMKRLKIDQCWRSKGFSFHRR